MIHIRDLAARAGVSTRALRYYEQQGLLHAAARTTSGQRVYTENAAERVELIQHLYSAGLSSRDVAVLIPCVENREAPAEAVTMLHTERQRLAREIKELQARLTRLDEVIVIATVPGACTTNP
ncbi:MerR family transcriptional regulator [Winogradskya consettensis]|uniref:MerR family transcriptional regulator n=1 Tax=Winogradskya consettensis TaxID=113560 RepID=A0A919SSM5_9ACTN|nr:MerR family transcriptional regulator [Actinoplanes consettensis]